MQRSELVQFDCETSLAGNTVRHGKLNNRIYVLDAQIDRPHALHKSLTELASAKGYTKIIAKVKDSQVLSFLRQGYQIEATVPGYFGLEDAIFVSYFLEQQRANCTKLALHDDILEKASQTSPWQGEHVANELTVRKATHNDARDISKLYNLAFSSYSSPVGNENYVKSSLDSGVDYFCMVYMNAVIGCIRVEYEADTPNARLYDIVVAEQFRNQGVATALVEAASQLLQAQNISFIYSVCRAASFAINKVFARLGYEYGGRLLNNNLINGELESMNVWSTKLGCQSH
jgi:putative beta-lysine N-acetyltransferase